ncbi:MAG: DoxX family protein [Bacteroidaceae bacterium]|nr:DoxX family protein [Bacteroidaceae bacterium]
MKKFFFPSVFPDASVSRLLLTLRLFFGFLFLMHGIDKLANFEVLSYSFPDPLGMGSHLSLVLVILSEVFCALTFIGGFLFRISLLPMLFAMFIAFFYAHGGSIADGELAFIYLGVFLLLLVTGPGRYSADYLIYRVVWGT